MKIDLSTISQPIGKYSTAADGNLQRFRLTKDQVNSYRKHGFVVGKESLSEEFMELLCADLDFLISPENANNSLWHECHLNECDSGSDVLFHALGAWRISEGFHDLLWQPAVTIPATQLLDADIR
ncbi:MAG: phytanoyl-CoA dioxygenase family protein, partial [Planctomycetaceae bacterium]|nr:phytanoyl-CoA dioxygenase family protein [Planctomycetaceae bacterium]